MRDFNAWADSLPTSFVSEKNARRAFEKLGAEDHRGTHMVWARDDGRFSNVVLNPSCDFLAFFSHNRVGVFGVTG